MTVIQIHDHHKMQQSEYSWLPMVGLFAASTIITVLAFVGAVDLIGRAL